MGTYFAIMKYWIVIFAIIFCFCEKHTEVRMDGNFQINYVSNSAGVIPPLSLTINNNHAILIILSNIGNPKVNRIGFLDSQIRDLLNILKSGSFIKINNPSAIIPGEIVRSFTCILGNRKEIKRFVGESKSEPFAFLKAEAIAFNMINKLYDYPKKALSLHAKKVPSTFPCGKPVKVIISITNIGEEPIQLERPDNWFNGFTHIELKSTRNDIPLKELNIEHQYFEIIEKENLINFKDFNLESQIVLLPKDSLKYEFKKALFWKSGSYDTQISYISSMLENSKFPKYDFELLTDIYNIKVNCHD